MRTHKLVSILLTLSLTVGNAPLQAAESGTTSALLGVKTALETTSSGIGAIQYSQQQMQGLVNQFAALRGQTANQGNAQSQFDLVKQQLSVALAEAGQCVEKAKKDTAKYKKATINPTALNSVEPTCRNYGNVIDSIKKNIDQMQETNTKMGCIRNMQNKINQIADQAKKPFGDLTAAAGQVWNTRKNIIDTHQGIVDRLDKDLNDEENGYKAKLGKLKELEVKIRNAISAGVSGKEGASGIGQRLKDVKRARVAAANSWYYDLMGDVEGCFATDGTQSCAFGTAASPADCIRAYVGSAPSGSAPAKALAKANAGKLDHAFRLNTGIIKRADSMSNIDVSNPNAFLAHVNKRFNEKLAAISTTFNNMSVAGNGVNKNQLRSFVQQKYRDCYSAAVQRFQSDMGSEGGKYKSAVNQVSDMEAGLNNEIRNLIDETQANMNGFRTMFNKVYNRDLSQFAADCTASESPYASADCLRKMQITLKGGIEGTKQSTTLEDGSRPEFTPGPTTMNLQTMALDQQGNPTLQTSQSQCVGFDECMNVLDRYQAHHSDQAESQKKQREAFVEQHNKTVQTAMVGVAAQFTEVSKMLVAATTGINDDLTKAGVNAAITTKQVAGENLEKDETTGIFKMPTSMKAALAGNGTYTEMDDVSEAVSSLNARIGELNKKATAAFKMKGLCAVKKGDFDAIANRLGNCDAASVCKGDKMASMLRPMESLLRKSQGTGSPDDKDNITREYQSCVRSNRTSNTRRSRQSEIEVKVAGAAATTDKEKLRAALENQLREELEEKKNEAGNCGGDAMGSLEALATDSRDSVKGTNDKIIAAIRKISDHCSEDPQDTDAAASACEEAKQVLRKASPPSNEGETILSDGGGGTTSFSNPLSKDAK